MNILAAIIVSLFLAVPAYADNGNHYGWYKDNPNKITPWNGGIHNDNTNNNTISGIVGQGGNAVSNSSVIGSEAIANVSSVNQDNSYTAIYDKRELPAIPMHQAPNMIEYRGPYEKGIAGKVKPWKEQKVWTQEEIEAYYKQFDSAECSVYKHRDAAKSSNLRVAEGSSPVIGYLDCKGESDFEIWGTAGKKALEIGGKEIQEKAYSVTFSNKSRGWNIGFGGGVTATGYSDDSRGGAVGGGTGFGSVETLPIAKIQAVFVVR